VIPPLLSFLLIISLILIFSKKELSVVLGISAIIFGLLTQVNIINSMIEVIINPSIVLLALSVLLIPILGGIMEESGLMLELIQNLKVSKKVALMVSPALFGLLPVAGGALMSAPIVDQIDPALDSNRKVAINVWYRHVLLLIYPLSSAILVASVLSGISLYLIVLALLIPFILMVFVGYFTLLKPVDKSKESTNRNLKLVFHNLIPLIIAPIIDFLGRLFFPISFPELFVFIGLIISISIALKFAKMNVFNIKEISRKMKVWRFPLLIISMFLFLSIFLESGVPEQISALNLPFALFISIGFSLGFTTGRVQLPSSILIPIYLVQNLVLSMPIIDFVFLYFAIYLGYLITPLHPCLAYNINYFKTNYIKSFKHVAIPTFICFGILYAVFFSLMLLVD
jgi:integral membrane protein (TIGR00529 family)